MVSLQQKSTAGRRSTVPSREFSHYASSQHIRSVSGDGAVHRVVLRALVTLANEDGLCAPSLYELAELTRLPLEQVERVVHHLKLLEHIKIDCCGIFAVDRRFLPPVRRA